eukprot:GFKZ01003331.1.p1 GENE.GFKZ01003331.1~~GFKZ01003331.1.p1  ORF type:complete len:848 (+),score=189.70 GFKZ01003331.1:197-2740(+)
MEDLASAQSEILRLQEQLATTQSNAESRIETMKTQHLEARSRAKAVIQKQRQQAQEKVAEYEKTVKSQATELDRLKEIEEDRDRFKSRMEELHALVASRGTDLEKVLAERETHERTIASLQEELAKVKDDATSKRVVLESEVANLERRLSLQSELKAEQQNVEACTTENAVAKRDIEEANSRILELETTCEHLRAENALLTKSAGMQHEVASIAPDDVENGASCNDDMDARSFDKLKIHTREAEERAKRLSEELMNTKEDFHSKQKYHEVVVENLTKRENELDQKVLSMEKQLSDMQETLKKNEMIVTAEREKVLTAQKNAAEAIANGDEEKKMMEAKIAEMERVIVSKQADITKVREKARSYLKDINGEKRDMEERMKKRVEALRKEVADSNDKLKDAELRAESTASELDNCLALIRDKQKIIQMLKMTISTEKKGAEEARKVTEAVRTEFAAYKERARLALQEKESTVETSSGAIEAATLAARQDLERTKKENLQLRDQIVQLREGRESMERLRERAEKAEAAVELLRKDVSGISQSFNYSQIDVLEERLATMEVELRAAQVECVSAEDRHQTTKMRLEAAEKALRSTEICAEESNKISARTIAQLQEQVETLEQKVDRANKSSAAAQRTAAAAAKALAFSESEEGTNMNSSYRNAVKSASSLDQVADDMPQFDTPEGLEPSRATFFAAMEGHSDILGLSLQHSNIEVDSRGTSQADILSRDKQIAVLTSQVSELGAMLDEAQQETNLKSEQTDLLKTEVKNLDAKLAAAEKLKNGAPFSYLRTIVVRYLETEDPTLLPVISNVLSFTDEENERVKNGRGSGPSVISTSGASQKSSYFSLPFLGS